MPDIDISIGGRVFSVSCQRGEEHFLQAAAAQYDSEAQPLLQAMGRLTESRMLLMAGLMLADKLVSQADELDALRARLAELEAMPEPEVQVVEVPVIPEGVADSFADLAEKLEAMAGQVEDRILAANEAAAAQAPLKAHAAG